MSSQPKPIRVEKTEDPFADVRLNTEKLDWSQTGLNTSLNVIYDYAVRKALGNIQWYKTTSQQKGRIARWLRIGAFIAAGLGSVVPILAGIEIDGAIFSDINPAFASVLLGLGASLLGFDQYFGYSSSWMRAITTGMDLKKELDAFQMKWESQRLAANGQAISFEEAQAFIQIAQEFIEKIENIVRAETDAWIVEFKNSMALLSRRLGQDNDGESGENPPRSNPPA